MAKARASQDDAILTAIEVVVRSADAVRLIAAGKSKPGAFANTKGGKAAAESCLVGDPPVLRVTEEVGGQRFVDVTPAGFDLLAKQAGAALRQELMDGTRVPPRRAAAMMQACIRAADRRYESIAGQVRETLAEHRQMADELRSAVRAYAGRVGDATAAVLGDLNDVRQQADDLRRELADITLPEPTPDALAADDEGRELPNAPAGASESFVPVDKYDVSFELAKKLAQEMVFAWEEATDDARPAIEAALLNGDIEMIGEPGQTVRFDAALHQGGSAGSSVEVTRVGWRLVGPRHRVVLAKAQVRPSSVQSSGNLQ